MAVPSFADKKNEKFMKENRYGLSVHIASSHHMHFWFSAFTHSSEFWFSAPGAGAKVHMDSHCVSTLSINLSGKRQYRLGPIPKSKYRSLGPVYDDGFAYSQGWKPLYTFNVSKGDAVLVTGM